MKPTRTVEEFCELIKQYQLMSSREYAVMRTRWFRPDRKDVGDAAQFCRWLVINRYVTEFVAKVLSGRKPAQLVLNQYRLLDQLTIGSMAGAYLAVDPLDRHVAIEILSAHSAADNALLASILKAAHNAMQVQHVNVGRILDTGEAHGLHYLVKEYYEGQTLAEILQRRQTLSYEQAARMIALALAGLDALHSHGVPGGDLAADCLLLTSASKDTPGHRTVKILHAGVKRKLFDEAAIGRSAATASIPDELELSAATTFHVADAGAVNVPDDIFRLGCVFYRTVTGIAPYEGNGLTPMRPAKPVCQVNTEIPEMVGQIIDEMIDPAPEKRPRKAAHIAKALRVFLASEEQRESKAEEQISFAQERPAVTPRQEARAEEESDEGEADSEPAQTPRQGNTASEAPEGLGGKLAAVWDEAKPEMRDLLFLAGGAVSTLLVILLIELLIGVHFVFVAGLMMGAAASYFVEMFIRWRRARHAEED